MGIKFLKDVHIPASCFSHGHVTLWMHYSFALTDRRTCAPSICLPTLKRPFSVPRQNAFLLSPAASFRKTKEENDFHSWLDQITLLNKNSSLAAQQICLSTYTWWRLWGCFLEDCNTIHFHPAVGVLLSPVRGHYQRSEKGNPFFRLVFSVYLNH